MLSITVIGWHLLMVFTLLAVPPALSVVLTAAENTPVDLALPMPQPRGGVLGTSHVSPDDDEKTYFEKLPADQLVTGSIFQGYDLAGQEGNYIGWYGIVRGIKENPAAKQTTLAVQHVYSDAQTDAHIMTVSCYGAGDFVTTLKGTHLPLLPLRLVKIYGKVKSYTAGKPTVFADFVKEWDWGNFNFMDYGADKSNQEWKALNKVTDRRQIYDPYPKTRYYRERLGDAPAHIYDVMTEDQVKRYAEKIPREPSSEDEMALPLTAPLFVGKVVRVDPEYKGQRMPFVLAHSQLSEYVEFVKAGMARRVAEIDKEHMAPIESDTDVLVVKYALPDELSTATYLVRPLSGKFKDQEWWLPGFVLKAKTNPTSPKK